MPPAIECENITKSFTRHRAPMLLRGHLSELFRRLEKPPRFYAVKDVSFRVERGEGVAIVGANGAGKSTLLSLITGLAEPDSGVIRVFGRIAALLELGSGFHTDLTGVENVRLNASLLGISRKRTNELFDEIVDFSGVGDFIRETLRTYSSGMIVRLAFSVAVCTEPEIMIIDEVLAVGDRAFQVKCLNRIRSLHTKGTTLLCVSHATSTIRDFCDRAIWLDHGQLRLDGPVRGVVEAYEGKPPTVSGAFQAAE